MQASAELQADTLKADRKAPQRLCLVTRASKDKAELIRFVVGPDQQLTPDLAGKLPGRGYWVSCDKAVLEQAITEKRFIKAVKETAQIAPDLAEAVERLLKERALQSLALANKAGAVISGLEKVSDAINSQPILAILHAEGASEDSMRKLFTDSVSRIHCFQSAELSAKLGLEHAVHLAVIDQPAGEAALKEIRRFTGFIGRSSL